MVLIRTETTQYTVNSYFEEIIDKFQDCKIKKKHKDSWMKKKKQTSK